MGKHMTLRSIDNQTEFREPQCIFSHEHGQLWVGDAKQWLSTLPDASVDLIFADPPYNVNKAEWDTFENQEAYVKWSTEWIKEAARVLKPEATMYICGYSEILADLRLPSARFFKGCRWLIWHYKNKANLGREWGRSHESMLHLRKGKSFTFNTDDVRIPYGNHTKKYPEHPQAVTSQYGKGKQHTWQPHPRGAKPRDVIELPTINNGMKEKTPHPTQKPEELLRRIILASSNEGDTIVDPFVGSGTTAVVAEQLGRKWLGCDISPEYIDWAVERIQTVERRPIEEWIKLDTDNLLRRRSIR